MGLSTTMRVPTILVVLGVISFTVADRLCVPGGASCPALNRAAAVENIDITCVPARDRVDCIERLKEGTVDITVVGNTELYLAHLLYKNEFSIIAETRKADEESNDHRYEGVAVVRKSKIQNIGQLKESKSCHTGYWRTAGWHIPITALRSMKQITGTIQSGVSVVEQDLLDVSRYFGAACIPGQWTPDEATDKKLKSKYPRLCELCGSSNEEYCSSEDNFSGYQGALECLLNGADVAWSKYSEVQKFFQTRTENEVNEYGLLCRDDRVIDINVLHNDVTHCAWAGRPWDTWLVRQRDGLNSKDQISQTLSKLIKLGTRGDQPEIWAKEALGTSSPSVIHDVPLSHIKYYLTQANFYATLDNINFLKKPIDMCVDSKYAKEKCLLMSKVMEASRIRPLLRCSIPDNGEACIAYVAKSDNFVTTVDGADAYHAHKLFDTSTVAAEKYGSSNASYYAVAVVKKSSGITSLKELRGKKSCHTGIGKTSGWKMPIATLLEKGLLPSGACDYPTELAAFFSSSCVPGAKEPKYDPQGTNPQSLCDLCIGDKGGGLVSLKSKAGSHCSRSDDERYSGYTGAFRCLVEAGDVAFVKHTTVPSNTDGNNLESWTQGLKATDFLLLCPNGGVAEVHKYLHCNLERVPAHQVIIGPSSTDLVKEEARILLGRASKSIPSSTFLMFGKFNGRKDLIFKDSATELVVLPTDAAHLEIQENYNNKLEELDSCGAAMNSGGKTTTASLFFILIGIYVTII